LWQTVWPKHARDLLDASPDRLRATARGQRFLNDLLQIFLPE
jgi:hypothetical protein